MNSVILKFRSKDQLQILQSLMKYYLRKTFHLKCSWKYFKMVSQIIYLGFTDKEQFARFCPETTALRSVPIKIWKFKKLVIQEHDSRVQ